MRPAVFTEATSVAGVLPATGLSDIQEHPVPKVVVKARPDKAEKQRQKRAAELEAAISELETRLTELSHQLEHARPDQVAALGTEYNRAEQQMQALIDEWAQIAA